MNKIKIEIWQFENGNLNIEIVDYTDKIRIPMDFTKQEIDESKNLFLWRIKRLLQNNTEVLERLKNNKDEQPC